VIGNSSVDDSGETVGHGCRGNRLSAAAPPVQKSQLTHDSGWFRVGEGEVGVDPQQSGKDMGRPQRFATVNTSGTGTSGILQKKEYGKSWVPLSCCEKIKVAPATTTADGDLISPKTQDHAGYTLVGSWAGRRAAKINAPTGNNQKEKVVTLEVSSAETEATTCGSTLEAFGLAPLQGENDQAPVGVPQRLGRLEVFVRNR